VAAAVIERDGRILICQRKGGEWHAFKWEFPGGKAEAGESPVRAIERELQEELAITASIGPEIVRYRYQYPGRSPILLVFFHVTEFEGEPRNLVFESMVWEPPERLPEYDFLEGDLDFIKQLAGRDD
jgi:8-oxo-dGTP diphosphatase